jgi:hypothetical protein
VEVDEPVQRIRWVGGLFDNSRGACQQPGADPDQQLDQQRLLVREVPVDRWSADTRSGTDVLQPHGEITALRDKAFRRGDQLAATVGFRPAAARARWCRHLHPLVDNSVNRD